MPRQVFDRYVVLDAALDLARERGYDSVSARAVASRAGCSVQPIYSQFGGMDGLMSALYEHGLAWVAEYGKRFAADAPTAFSAAGRTHIFLAQEEPLLFSFLYQSPYMGTRSLEDLFALAARPGIIEELQASIGLDLESAHAMYLDMIIYTHGLASVIASGGTIPIDEIAERMNGAYSAFSAKWKEASHV